MAFMAAAATCLILTSTWGGSQYDWDSPVIIGLIVGTVVASVLFVLVERRAAEPIVPLHLFRDRNFNLTTVAGLLTGVMMFGTLGYMPTYLQMVTGAEATAAGLLMTPMMGALLLTSIVTGQFVSRTGRYKWIPVAGSLLVTAGSWSCRPSPPPPGLGHLRLPCRHRHRTGHQHATAGPDGAELLPASQVGTATAPTTSSARSALPGLGGRGQPLHRAPHGLPDERLPGGPHSPPGAPVVAHPGAGAQNLPDFLARSSSTLQRGSHPLFLVLARWGSSRPPCWRSSRRNHWPRRSNAVSPPRSTRRPGPAGTGHVCVRPARGSRKQPLRWSVTVAEQRSSPKRTLRREEPGWRRRSGPAPPGARGPGPSGLVLFAEGWWGPETQYRGESAPRGLALAFPCLPDRAVWPLPSLSRKPVLHDEAEEP